jgi:hypothetical protein
VRHHLAAPRLRIDQIRAWARAHRDRTGVWPTRYSGPVDDAPEETWAAIDAALVSGLRGLPGGSSLAALRRAEHPRAEGPGGSGRWEKSFAGR